MARAALLFLLASFLHSGTVSRSSKATSRARDGLQSLKKIGRFDGRQWSATRDDQMKEAHVAYNTFLHNFSSQMTPARKIRGGIYSSQDSVIVLKHGLPVGSIPLYSTSTGRYTKCDG